MEFPSPPRADQLIAMIVEIVVYCIHLSVIIVMVSLRKTVFNSAFYNILLTICFVDLSYFLFNALFLVRFISYGFFPQFYLRNVWLASVGYTASNVFGFVQFIGQTLMSMNRFTVFWFPAKHDKIWNKPWYWVVLIGLPLLIIPTRIPDGGKIVYSKNGAVITYASEAIENLASYTTLVVYVVNGTITAVLSALTVFKYWRLRVSGNVQPVPQLEARMLAFSIIIFCIQSMRFIYAVLRNMFMIYPNIIAVLMYILPFISDLHAWVCSFSVIFMSRASRKAYFDFYFGSVMKRKATVSAVQQRRSNTVDLVPMAA